MERRTVHLSLDLRVDDGALSGYVGSGGERRAIWGRLGLLGAIERLLAEDGAAPAAGFFGEAFHRAADDRQRGSRGGFRWSYLATGAESGGSYLVMEVELPRGRRPLPHQHGVEDLAVVLIEGEARYRLGEEVGAMGVGDFVNVPRGTVHAFWNEGAKPARLLVTAMPAGLESLIAARCELERAGSKEDWV